MSQPPDQNGGAEGHDTGSGSAGFDEDVGIRDATALKFLDQLFRIQSTDTLFRGSDLITQPCPVRVTRIGRRLENLVDKIFAYLACLIELIRCFAKPINLIRCGDNN